jgi:hypothetical protein
MRANEALEKHATFVMATLDETISHIDNYDFVKNLTDRTGSSHQRFSDFQRSLPRRVPLVERTAYHCGAPEVTPCL